MDGYVIADWMESQRQGPLNVAEALLSKGDGGDKLYAAIYLLMHGLLKKSKVDKVIFENCESEETLDAWRGIAQYVSNPEVPLFGEVVADISMQLRENVTFYRLLPMVIRSADKQAAISSIKYFSHDHTNLNDDMNEIIARIEAR